MAKDSFDDINILENTNEVIADLDCGGEENPDKGLDICAVRDKSTNGFGEDTEKPTSYVLTLGDELTSVIDSTQGEKLEVGEVLPGDDGDGTYYVVVSKDSDPSKTDNLFYSGDVDAGGSFVADGTGATSFGSETFVHIFSADGGTLLQTINFHTSCSVPLVIGDQYGSITLEGASLEGKDSGTIYTVGQTEASGDAGVVYEITGGNDADDFVVDPDTGEVTFITPPDFENPTDSDGDNNYDVEVTAYYLNDDGSKGSVCDVKTLEVCVGDDCINILENTNEVIADLDCGGEENPDKGLDICAVRDKSTNGFGEDTEKPTSYVLTLGDELTSVIDSTQGEKLEVGEVLPGDDGDGTYYVVVSKDSDPSKTDNLFYSGDVDAGGSFVADGTGATSFGSETFVHIFSADGGTLLQTINFHTSCSVPLVIGDQYGSITLEGASLEGKDSGTIYTVGQTEASGDAGVVYSIDETYQDGALFTVNDEGEVTFIEAPDYENPQDIGGDNKYEVKVICTTDEGTEEKVLEVCVDNQDCISILENTNPGVIADLDCEEQDENPDLGKEICAERDALREQGIEADKPNQLTLTLSDDLTSVINSAQEGSKLEVNTFDLVNPDGGGLYVLVSNNDDPGKLDTVYFSGDVDFGQSFTALASAAGDEKFGSETFIHIFSADGGQLLQTINYHTSCSAPITIGDELGLVSLDGVGLFNKGDGSTIEFGGSVQREVVYEITAGDGFDQTTGTSPFFNVDPETGEITLAFTPDFENPLDDNGDNSYFVEVTGYFVNADGTREICDVKPIEICVEDVVEVGSLSGRYFCDTNDNDVDDGQAVDPGIAGVVVTAFDAAGNVAGTAVTKDDGTYSITGLERGDYSVAFTDPDGVLDGKVLVDPNDPNGNGDDTNDSDAIGDTTLATIPTVTVNAGEDTPDNDAGAEYLPGSLSGRYFCDTNDNDVDDGQAVDPGIAGVVVTAFDAAGNVAGTAVTKDDGTYSITGLERGDYSVAFTDPDGVLDGKVLVDPNDPNGNGDDTNDSDAIGDTTLATIPTVTVNAGEDTPDNDAGAELANLDPEPNPDVAAVCSDEKVTIDVLENDADPEEGPLTITAVDGQAITDGGSVTLSVSQAVVTLIGGQLVYDLSELGDIYDGLPFGSEGFDNFTYTVEDAAGASATTEVDLKVCGSANSLLTDGIPATISYNITDVVLGNLAEAFTVDLSSADGRFDGLVVEEVYCIDAFIGTEDGVFIDGNFALATESNADALGLLPAVGDNINLINYILNQDYTSQDNGDGTSTNYTDLEVQGAIWEFTNGDDFIFGPGGTVGDSSDGTQANVDEIIADAIANGSEFELGDGSVVAAFLVPTESGFENTQPYIVAFECECDTFSFG